MELWDEGSPNFRCRQKVGAEKRWHECLGQWQTATASAVSVRWGAESKANVSWRLIVYALG